MTTLPKKAKCLACNLFFLKWGKDKIQDTSPLIRHTICEHGKLVKPQIVKNWEEITYMELSFDTEQCTMAFLDAVEHQCDYLREASSQTKEKRFLDNCPTLADGTKIFFKHADRMYKTMGEIVNVLRQWKRQLGEEEKPEKPQLVDDNNLSLSHHVHDESSLIQPTTSGPRYTSDRQAFLDLQRQRSSSPPDTSVPNLSNVHYRANIAYSPYPQTDFSDLESGDTSSPHHGSHPSPSRHDYAHSPYPQTPFSESELGFSGSHRRSARKARAYAEASSQPVFANLSDNDY
ncbi:hypothetical protein T439DRAFT_378280 [Meredithblackwellia eburnea MCA 4105]